MALSVVLRRRRQVHRLSAQFDAVLGDLGDHRIRLQRQQRLTGIGERYGR